MNMVRAHNILERKCLVKSVCSYYTPIKTRAKRIIKMAQVVKLLTAKPNE